MSRDKRHWKRRALDAAFWPLRIFCRKGRRGWSLSLFRVILFGCAVAFVRHWPAEWTMPAVAALAVIVFALPLEDLFARVPVAEAMGALQAFFGSVVGRAADTIRSRSGGSDAAL